MHQLDMPVDAVGGDPDLRGRAAAGAGVLLNLPGHAGSFQGLCLPFRLSFGKIVIADAVGNVGRGEARIPGGDQFFVRTVFLLQPLVPEGVQFPAVFLREYVFLSRDIIDLAVGEKAAKEGVLIGDLYTEDHRILGIGQAGIGVFTGQQLRGVILLQGNHPLVIMGNAAEETVLGEKVRVGKAVVRAEMAGDLKVDIDINSMAF